MESVTVSGYESQLLHSLCSPGGNWIGQLAHHNLGNCTMEVLHSQGHQPRCQVVEWKAKKLPNLDDKKYWILAAVALILVRRFVERCIFKPLGRALGIKDQAHTTLGAIPCRDPSAVLSLQTAYSSNKKLSNEQLQALSKETGLKQREIERWMRKRQAFDKPSTLVKFSESGWRLFAYMVTTLLGIVSMWDKWWFWNFAELWKDYPNHELSNSIWWYYLLAQALYISFTLTQFFDVKRKDFWEMFLHHILAITLLTLTFYANMTRIGIIFSLLHDCADVFLEFSKMANYAKKKNLSTWIFLIFTMLWFVTRLWILPVNIIYGSLWQASRMEILPRHIGYPIVGMSLLLQGLHIFWSYFICKVVWSAVQSGPPDQLDSRSSSESSECSSDSDSDQKEDATTSSSSSFMMKQRRIMRKISVEIMERNE